MVKLQKDYFMDEKIPLYQHPDHFHFNTDTKLLAQFMELRKEESVLDIGTNNGVLLLAADKSEVSKLIGVEVLEEAIKIAQINLETFGKHPFLLYCKKVQELDIEPVDVILSNPPFFTQLATHANTKVDMRQLGRIEQNLTLEQLICHAHRLLKSNGRFYFVHRPNRINEIFQLLSKYCFSVRRIQFVYAKTKPYAKSVLIEAYHERMCDAKVEKPIILE